MGVRPSARPFTDLVSFRDVEDESAAALAFEWKWVQSMRAFRLDAKVKMSS